MDKVCPDCGILGEGKCSYCNGSGEDESIHETLSHIVEGDDAEYADCPECEGTGICSTCDGTGFVSDDDEEDDEDDD
jgi:DnaJ-class molecular chaperone